MEDKELNKLYKKVKNTNNKKGGNSKINKLDVTKINIYIDDVCLVENGERSKSYTEERGKGVMEQDEIILRINLKRGSHSEEIWTTDLSNEYIKINSEYRS